MSNNTIFLSSTFKDMHAERDIIHDIVIPELSFEFGKYGCNIDFVDLRWGVDTNDPENEIETTTKIVQVCFDEIERSEPFFVCFIGERYGWIPDRNIIRSACMSVDVSSDRYEQLSITEMEIEYALSKYQNIDNCFFFIREGISAQDIKDPYYRDIYFSDNSEDIKKINLLKSKLEQLYPEHTIRYSCYWDEDEKCIKGLEGLADLLIEKLSKSVSEKTDIISMDSELGFVSERVMQENHFTRISSQSVNRSAYTDKMTAFALDKGAEKEMAIVAQSGLGKTSLMACVSNILESRGVYVLKMSAGLTQKSSDFKFMVRYFYEVMSEDFNRTVVDGDYDEIKKNFLSLLYDISEKQRVVILVDALNQFSFSHELSKLDWLSDMFVPENVRIIYSALPEQFDEVFRRRGVKINSIEKLNEDEIQSIILNTAKRFHKQLSSDVVGLLSNRKNKCGEIICSSPLYLSLIIEYISDFDIEDYNNIAVLEAESENNYEAINRYILRKISDVPDDVTQLFGAMSKKCEKIISPDAVRLINTLLRFSRFGVRESDVLAIAQLMGINLSAADFSLYRKRFRLHLVQREDGRWDFTHSIIKGAVSGLSETLDSEWTKRVSDATADCFLSLPYDDKIRQCELLYYLGCSRRYKTVCDVIAGNEKLSRTERRELLLLLLSDADGDGRGVHAKELFGVDISAAYAADMCSSIVKSVDENLLYIQSEDLLKVLLEVIDWLRCQNEKENLELLSKAYFLAGKCLNKSDRAKSSVIFQISISLAKKVSPDILADYLRELFLIYYRYEEYRTAVGFAKKLVYCLRKNKRHFSSEEYSDLYAQACVFMAEGLKKAPFIVSYHLPVTWYRKAMDSAPEGSAVYVTACSGYLCSGSVSKKKKNFINYEENFDTESNVGISAEYFTEMGDRSFIRDSAEAERMYYKALESIRKSLKNSESENLLVQYELVAERLGYLFSIRKDSREKAVEFLSLAQRLCRKIYIVKSETEWNDRRLRIINDIHSLNLSENGTKENLTEDYDDAVSVTEHTIKNKIKNHSEQFDQFARKTITGIIICSLLVWLVIIPLIRGNFNMSSFGYIVANALMFVLGFLLTLPIVQFYLGSMEMYPDTISYHYNRKRFFSYTLLYVAVLSINVFIVTVMDLGSYVEGNVWKAIFKPTYYYVLNATLVFVLCWFGVCLFFNIFQLYYNKERIKRFISKKIHKKQIIKTELTKLTVTALLPVTFYIAIISGVKFGTLSYQGHRVEDFWKIHWLPFVLQLVISAVTLFPVLKGYSVKIKRNGGLAKTDCTKRLRGMTFKGMLCIVAVFTTLMLALSVYSVQLRSPSDQAGEINSFDDFDYVETRIGISIAKYKGDSTEIIIPSAIEEKPVTVIGSSAFAGSNIESITIPDSVMQIDSQAFSECRNLLDIIGGTEIRVINSKAFFNCSSLEAVPFLENVMEIRSEAFQGCTGLKEVKFSNNLALLGTYAFEGCSGLSKIYIPDSLEEVSDGAFNNCANVTELRLGKNLKKVHIAFAGCEKIKTIYFDSRDCKIHFGHSSETGLRTPFDCLPSFEKLVIGEDVERINNIAFTECASLKEIVWNNKLTVLGGGAFAECTSLEKVILPSSITTVEKLVFADCTALKSFTISENVTQFDETVLEGCENVKVTDLRKNTAIE